MMTLHPCQSCGACCASFRVAFYWMEAGASELAEIVSGNERGAAHVVPVKFVEDLDERTRCMKGTNDKHKPKCIALEGKIGSFVTCSIYDNRPSPCRAFKASYEFGYREVRCDEARSRHGLEPLSKHDWVRFKQNQILPSEK